jgi:Zn-finger nucleic acid-binding protein
MAQKSCPQCGQLMSLSNEGGIEWWTCPYCNCKLRNFKRLVPRQIDSDLIEYECGHA